MSGRGLALAGPLTGFLLVFFVLPIAWLLSLAVREAEVPRALPRTLVATTYSSRIPKSLRKRRPGTPSPSS